MQRTFAKQPAESRTNWLAPVLAVVLLVLVAGGAGWMWLRPRTPLPTPEVGKETAERFLTQIKTGQAAAAWQSTTADFKSDEGQESFLRHVHQHAALWPSLEFKEYQQSTLNDLPRGQCLYQATPGATLPGGIRQVRIAVAKEATEWKVEGLFLDKDEATSQD